MSLTHLLKQIASTPDRPVRKHRITEEEIEAIREALSNGVKQKDIAKKFHVSLSTISLINRGTYNRYTSETHSERHRGQNNGRSVLTETQVLAVRAAREKGQSYKSLSKQYGISPAAIRNICLRISWKHI